MKHVTFRGLKVFEAVARHLSFSRAAEELHLTQPAVSMQVRQVEDGVGLPLTEQVGRRIFLTAAGAELARHARLIAQQIAEAANAMDELKGTRRGRIHIGVVSTAKYFAPHLLALFRREHPEVEVKLAVLNRELIIHQLAENEIDMAIMGRPPEQFETVAQPFADHPLIVIASPAHPLARRARIDPKALAADTFLMREQGSGTRMAMERFFSGHGVVPAATLEVSSNETIKQAVMAGLGISFLSAHAVGLEIAAGRLVRLRVAGTPVMRRWFVVRRAEKRLLPLAEAFSAFLVERGAALIDAIARGNAPSPAPARTRRPARRAT
ncbi:MAG: LysR family transcriptional regulator [Rhodocyclaceae bacterium]